MTKILGSKNDVGLVQILILLGEFKGSLCRQSMKEGRLERRKNIGMIVIF